MQPYSFTAHPVRIVYLGSWNDIQAYRQISDRYDQEHGDHNLSVLQPSVLLSTFFIRPATFRSSLNFFYPSCNLPFFSTLIRYATFHSSLNFSYPSCNLSFFSKLFLSVLQPSILLSTFLIRPATFHFSLNSSYPFCKLPFFS